MTDKSRFHLLISKYLNGTLAPDEFEQLKNMMSDHAYQVLFEESVEAMLRKNTERDETPPGDVKNKIFHALANKIYPVTQVQNHNRNIPRVFTFKKIIRFSIAACLVIAIGTFYYLYRSAPASGKENKIAGQSLPRIQPGSNKATLTLGDGSTVVLGNDVSGEIASQGAVKIIQLDTGRLSYSGIAGESEVQYNTITTPRGGQYQVILPDGSTVWLNAASSLRFPTRFKGALREVELTGQAFFDISHNKKHPFIVKVSDMQVEVLGTQFDVMAYAEEAALNTTLVEGSVKLKTSGHPVMLTPGQQGSRLNAEKIMEVKPVNVNEVIAWKDGRFYFEGTSVQSIMRQLQRWYDVDIEYGDKVKGIQLSGIVSRKEQIQDLLEALEATGDVHFKIKGRTVIVLGGKNKN
ncbi:MAG: FecR domain-containing protein [Agriterribacter sp.]